MKPKRIVHVIPSLDQAGAEKQLVLLACGLPAAEFEVHVCALTRGGPRQAELAAGRIPVTVVGKRWRVAPVAFWRLRNVLARLQPDLVHTWLFAGNAYGRAAARLCGVPRIVAGERCVDPWKSSLQWTIDRRLARWTDRLVANSPAVRDFAVEHGLPAERWEVIPNAVPEPPASTLAREQLLDELELPRGARLVGLVGRLWPQKRVKDAIWALDLLKVIRDDVHLLILGDGPQRDRLHRYRDQVRIRDKVHFLGHRRDAANLLPHFDVLLSTSAYEGQSNAILEAMAAGVPVVASDIPGTRDLVLPGQTGLLAPRGDRAEFAKQIQRLLDDPPLAARLREAALQRVRCEFGVEAMVGRYADLYRRLLD